MICVLPLGWICSLRPGGPSHSNTGQIGTDFRLSLEYSCQLALDSASNLQTKTPRNTVCCSVTKSCPTLCDPSGLQHTRFLCPPLFLRACSNSCPLSQWCYPTISSSVTPFSSCPQPFSASGSFPMSRLFASGGQSIRASALPMNIQGWFPLGLTGLISLQSKGFSIVFSNATIGKHQFFGTQPSLWSNFHIHTWLLGRP